MLRALHDHLVVDPYYDADKIGSIYIPEAFKNPEPQQGFVLSAGADSKVNEGVMILFHPFRSVPLQGTNLIALRDKDVVAYLVDGELVPLEYHLMILPDWSTKYAQKGLIYLPPTAQEDHSPVMIGTIAIGTVGEFSPGTKVVIPPGKGSEIGFKDTVYYFIHQDEILAIINDQDS